VVSDELSYNTSPFLNDSDFDGLDDGPEVHTHGTEPAVNDTDGDGVEDGPEVNRLNTDPTQSDSDNDGTNDGQETYTLTVENKTADVTVEITGQGNVARGLDIRRVTENETDTTRIGYGIRVDTNREFQYAKVTQPVSDSVSVDEDNVSLYKWSRRNDDGLHEVNATYDAGANTVTANVTSFSSFNVMDQSKIEEQNTQIAHIDNTWPTFEGFDGGPWSGGGEVTTNNSKLVIDHNTSISDAGSWAEETIDLTDDYEEVRIHAGGSVSAGTWGYAKVYVVYPTDPAKEGYWNSTNRVLLAQAYGDPDGGESSGLASKNISQFIGEKAQIRAVAYGDAEVNIDWIRVERHSDTDAISDAVEKKSAELQEMALLDLGMRQERLPLNLNPDDPDTDNDELPDSIEVELSCLVCMTPKENITVKKYNAHPDRKRTDDTGPTDGEEWVYSGEWSISELRSYNKESSGYRRDISSSSSSSTVVNKKANPTASEHIRAFYTPKLLTDHAKSDEFKATVDHTEGIRVEDIPVGTSAKQSHYLIAPDEYGVCSISIIFIKADCGNKEYNINVHIELNSEARKLIADNDGYFEFDWSPTEYGEPVKHSPELGTLTQQTHTIEPEYKNKKYVYRRTFNYKIDTNNAGGLTDNINGNIPAFAGTITFKFVPNTDGLNKQKLEHAFATPHSPGLSSARRSINILDEEYEEKATNRCDKIGPACPITPRDARVIVYTSSGGATGLDQDAYVAKTAWKGIETTSSAIAKVQSDEINGDAYIKPKFILIQNRR
jgi:hypothetical protein